VTAPSPSPSTSSASSTASIPTAAATDPAFVSELGKEASLSVEVIRARAEGENFPIAIPGVFGSLRRDLLALYDYARLVDQVGDDVSGDRMRMLEELSEDISRIPNAEPRNPIVRQLASVVRRHDLPIEALERLIEANRRDQTLRFVSSWEELLDTCTRSANPVGELVLGVLGQASDETIPPSNAVCSALQVVEHCQDVHEDFFAGRIYLPADDMVRFGCQRWDLKHAPASRALRQTVQFQVERARTLLAEADPLLCRLRGVGLPLVAAYAAGGLATCDALERFDFDVLSTDIRPRRRDIFRHWLGLCWRAMKSRVR
jgi:phytoene synthase